MTELNNSEQEALDSIFSAMVETKERDKHVSHLFLKESKITISTHYDHLPLTL